MLFAASAGARAQSTDAIVIVRVAEDESVVMRLRAELDASAYRVVELAADARSERAPLVELAAAHAARAALRVRANPRRVELWTAGPAGDADGTLDTIAARAPEPRGDEVLALRVTETLRARGLDLAPVARAQEPAAAPREQPAMKASEPRVERPEPAPAARDDSEARPAAAAASDAPESAPPDVMPIRTPQVWLELAPAVAFSPGGLGPQPQALLSLRLQLARFVSIAGIALIPLWGERIAGDEGSARIATALLGFAIDLHLRAQPFELAAGLGFAGVFVHMRGSAPAPFDGADELVPAVAPLARASLHVELGGGVRVCARIHAGVSLPRLSIQFVEREVANWGQPFATASLGLELALPDGDAAR